MRVFRVCGDEPEGFKRLLAEEGVDVSGGGDGDGKAKAK